MSLNKARSFKYIYHLKLVFKAGFAFAMLRLLKPFKVMNFKLKERLMLAVTEVNGCAMCSFVHTKLALQAGLSIQEIKNILNGELKDIPDQEVLAVLFAQDYAANLETIDPKFLDKLNAQYGPKKTYAIIKVLEMITMTNSMGINIKHLRDTLMFKHHPGSNILNELLIPLTTMILFPIVVLLSLVIAPFKVYQVVRG